MFCYLVLFQPGVTQQVGSFEVDLESYVDRSFALLDDLSKEMMNQSRRKNVLFFLGPSGTGKTTTLQALYCKLHKENKDQVLYIDAKYEELKASCTCMYAFVDNAQCLKQKSNSVGFLRHAKSLCLAFSPLLYDQSGTGTDCGFHFTKEYHFRPFTDDELDEYADRNKDVVSRDVVEKAKEIGVLLPRMVSQCSSPTSVESWIHKSVSSFVLKIDTRMKKDSRIDEVLNFIMNAAMGVKLTLAEEPYAYNSGLFYKDVSGEMRLVLPSEFFLQHLERSIISHYVIFKAYDKGGAYEFLVCARLKHHPNVIHCLGDKPTPVGEELSSAHPSFGKPEFEIPAAGQYIVQTACHDDLKCEQMCCLVKLCESHYGVDFLVIYNPAGADSKKLLLIQASVTKYQTRRGPRLNKIYEKKDFLGIKKESCVKFYCEKTGVDNKQCFFVYASSEIPNDDWFTRDKNAQNKVYFLKVLCN
jgi:Cdc6-like AAA superfamily ATPase